MKTFLLILFTSVTFCYAQIPPGYYNSAQGLTGNNLKIALHNIIDNHTVISYSGLLNAYKKTDKKPNGKVCDIYSDVPNGTPPYEYDFGDNCGNYSDEGDCYNREHSWPQSWFNSVSGPVSDLFHVYPTDGKVNSKRSNYPYGNVDIPTWTSLNGSKLGYSSDVGYSGTVFEPIDEYKGDLARTYFYMSTRYYSEDAGWASSGATNKSTILPWQVNVLLAWHHQDPVSAMEISRNDSIYYLYQNNRNPFIDNPQWADSIWQSTITTFLQEINDEDDFSIFSDQELDVLIIKVRSNAVQPYYKIFNAVGQLIDSGKLLDNKIDLQNFHYGIYFIQLNAGNKTYSQKFIKQ